MAENKPALTGTSGMRKNTIFDVIAAWSLTRKLSLVAVAALSILLFSLIIMQARIADYSLLFANLPSRDAAEVVQWLKDRKIPYRIEGGGSIIMIPAEQVHETRIELAGSGLADGGVGFEIFDKQSFGMTDFTQKVNYRRALQGELTRTISSLAPVEAARIHLALPEKRLFRDQQQPATASVIIKLSAGRSLKEAQVQGIVNLVAGSVEGLDAEHVTVVDSSGRTLSNARGEDSPGPMTPGMLSYQQTMESRLEHRAQSLLDRALGVGNALVRITADVDFDQRERVEESLDPRGAVVVSEQTLTEAGGTQTTGGVPGVVSNLEDTDVVVSSIPASRTEETVNYELSKVVSKTVQSVGTVKSLSVSVLVADRIVAAGDGEETLSAPRSAEEILEIEQMVRTSLGLNDERGDLISVVSMPFESSFVDTPLPQPSMVDKVYPLLPVIKYGLLMIAALLVYLLFLRPLLRTLGSAAQQTQPLKTVEELEKELLSRAGTPLLGGPDDPLAQVRQEVLGGDPLTVQVVKNWLREKPVES